MKKILDYFLSVLYLLYFGLMLLLFHAVQLVAYNIFGKEAHKKTVVWFNFCLVHGWYLTGSHVHFEQRAALPPPRDRPIIFVANHQSMFDIPGLIWFLRKYYPLFVSKIELSRGIPGISYNLRIGGAALIDRKDGKRAVVEIAKLGQRIHDAGGAAAIFPRRNTLFVRQDETLRHWGPDGTAEKSPRRVSGSRRDSGNREIQPERSIPPDLLHQNVVDNTARNRTSRKNTRRNCPTSPSRHSGCAQ